MKNINVYIFVIILAEEEGWKESGSCTTCS